MRERKRKHDDVHYPLGGRGKRATTPKDAVSFFPKPIIKMDSADQRTPHTYSLWEIVTDKPTGRFSISYCDADGLGWHISDVGFIGKTAAREFMRQNFPGAIEKESSS